MVIPEIQVMLEAEPMRAGPRLTHGPDRTGPTETQAIQVLLVQVPIQVPQEAPVIRGPTETRVLRALRALEPGAVVPHQILGPDRTARMVMPEIQGRQVQALQVGVLHQTLGRAKTVQMVMPETRAQQVRERQTGVPRQLLGPVSLEQMVTPAMPEQTALEPPPVTRAVQAIPE